MAYELAERVLVRFIRISVGIGVSGLTFVKVVPDFFPETIGKNVVGAGKECSPRCKTQFQRTARKMDVDEQKVDLFMTKGMSGFSCGRTWLPNGAVLGLPVWYLCETADDVSNTGINFKQRGIKWDSEMGTKIRDALVPTDDMIAFTIGHELAHIQHTDPKLKAANVLMAPTWLLATYKLAVLTSKLKLPRLLDVVMKLCVCRASYLVHKKANKQLQNAIEFQADEAAAKCHASIARGGVEFFLKRLELNKVLRVLHGTEGEKYYSEEGDEVDSYLHPKLTERLQRLQAILSQQMEVQGEPGERNGMT